MANPVGNNPKPGFFQQLGQNLGNAADRTASAVGSAGRFVTNGGVLGHTSVNAGPNGVNVNVNPNQPNGYGQTMGTLNRVLFPVTNAFDFIK
jgi:hypothetical protein